MNHRPFDAFASLEVRWPVSERRPGGKCATAPKAAELKQIADFSGAELEFVLTPLQQSGSGTFSSFVNAHN